MNELWSLISFSSSNRTIERYFYQYIQGAIRVSCDQLHLIRRVRSTISLNNNLGCKYKVATAVMTRNYSTSLWNKDHTLHHISAELKSSLKVGTVRKLTLFEVVLVDFAFGPATERHFAASDVSWQRE